MPVYSLTPIELPKKREHIRFVLCFFKVSVHRFVHNCVCLHLGPFSLKRINKFHSHFLTTRHLGALAHASFDFVGQMPLEREKNGG